MPRTAALVVLFLSLVIACGPVLHPVGGAAEMPAIEGPSRAEIAVASGASYVLGGLPPLLLAVLAASYGWSAPVIATFALGGAAYSLLDPAEGARADAVPSTLRATAGAARGLVFFPAMMGFAGRKVYGPYLARSLHEFRARF